jgi:hypothetical protein
METTMRSRWAMPAFGLLLGVLFFAASAIGGDSRAGLVMFAVMAVYSAVIAVFGGRIETLGILGGRPVDERLATFDIQATAVAGTVALVIAIVGFLWSIAIGRSGQDFALVTAAGGIAYIAALLWFRRRG